MDYGRKSGDLFRGRDVTHEHGDLIRSGCKTLRGNFGSPPLLLRKPGLGRGALLPKVALVVTGEIVPSRFGWATAAPGEDGRGNRRGAPR